MAVDQVNLPTLVAGVVEETAFETEKVGDKHRPIHGVRDGGDETQGSKGDAAATSLASASLISLIKALLKAEDTAHASGDFGMMALGIRKDLAAALAGTDGDYAPFIFDANGRLHAISVQLMQYLSTKPTYVNGDLGMPQMDTKGGGYMMIKSENSTGTAAVTASADGRAASNGVVAIAQNDVFDGSNYQRQRGNATGTIVIPPAGWSYAAAASGIASDTADKVLAAAAGAGIRNYLQSMQIDHDVLGAVTEWVIKDGSTVIKRGRLQTPAVEGKPITFNPPLRSSANAALNFALITSVTGAVYPNAQGFTAP